MKKDQSAHSQKQKNRIENNSMDTKTISLLHWYALFSLVKTDSYDMYILHTQHRPNKIHNSPHMHTSTYIHTQKKNENKIMYLFIYHRHILPEIIFKKQGSIICPMV
jgi:hypothetical protein